MSIGSCLRALKEAHFLVSIGETVGFADYTSFIATDKYLRENAEVVQNWTNAVHKSLRWTSSATSAVFAKAVEQFFPGVIPTLIMSDRRWPNRGGRWT